MTFIQAVRNLRGWLDKDLLTRLNHQLWQDGRGIRVGVSTLATFDYLIDDYDFYDEPYDDDEDTDSSDEEYLCDDCQTRTCAECGGCHRRGCANYDFPFDDCADFVPDDMLVDEGL